MTAKKSITDVDLSVIVPVYGSVESLPLIVDRVRNALQPEPAISFEIIFVDDCSPDPGSWPMLLSLAEKNAEVRAAQLTRNFGRTGAVLAGVKLARGDWIAIMDDDLQHRPEDIPRLWAEREHDVVLAQFDQKIHGLTARLGSALVTVLEHWLLGLPKQLKNSAFMLIKTSIAKIMLQMPSPHPFLPALIMEITDDVVGVRATHDPRHDGKPVYSFTRRVKLFANLMINNSALLLRGIAAAGITMSSLSFLYGAVLLLRGASDVPGWTSLMVVTLIIGGLVLMSLGVAGEYLVRIIRSVESRPTYILRQEITGSARPDARSR
jgi:glycosyltransferase involved in cell wall biosynthesis